jgi:hypothetical protein
MHTGSENFGLKLETEYLEQQVETSDRSESEEYVELDEEEEVSSPEPSSAPPGRKGREDPAESASRGSELPTYCAIVC